MLKSSCDNNINMNVNANIRYKLFKDHEFAKDSPCSSLMITFV